MHSVATTIECFPKTRVDLEFLEEITHINERIAGIEYIYIYIYICIKMQK